MHPAIPQQLAQAKMAELHRQAGHDRPAPPPARTPPRKAAIPGSGCPFSALPSPATCLAVLGNRNP